MLASFLGQLLFIVEGFNWMAHELLRDSSLALRGQLTSCPYEGGKKKGPASAGLKIFIYGV